MEEEAARESANASGSSGKPEGKPRSRKRAADAAACCSKPATGARARAPAKSAKNVYAYTGAAADAAPLPADTNESLVLKLRVRPDAPVGLGAFNDADLEGFAGVDEGKSSKSHAGASSFMPYKSDEPQPPDAHSPCHAEQQQGAGAARHPAQADRQDRQDRADAAAPPRAQSALRVVDLLKDFEEKTKGGEWPLSTTISCYWCCHRFETQPFGLPVKYSGGAFHVMGCFCSLGCAAAYNMATRDSVDEIFERQSLLNILSRRLGLGNRVRPAPPRLSLHMFGGHLSIEEFRALTQASAGGKVLTLTFPPMAMLRQQIEEVNESDVASDLRYVPLDTDRINKYRERLKLQRKRPVQGGQNTLDAVMQLSQLGAPR